MATPTHLAHLQLAAAKGDIMAAAEGEVWLVHNICLYNSNSAAETVTLYRHDGTNEYVVVVLEIAAGETVFLTPSGEGWVFDGDDDAKLTGMAETAAKITCSIDGSIL
jgi:hypothetical protein